MSRILIGLACLLVACSPAAQVDDAGHDAGPDAGSDAGHDATDGGADSDGGVNSDGGLVDAGIPDGGPWVRALPVPAFPCTSPAAPRFSEDFEGGLGGWTLVASGPGGEARTEASCGFRSNHCLVLDYQDAGVAQVKIQRAVTPATDVVATVYFYDDGLSPRGAMVLADDGTDAVHLGLGLMNASSGGFYQVRVGAGPGNTFDSPVPRTVGWHELALVVTPSGAWARIDQQLIARGRSDLTTLRRLSFVATWGLTGPTRWDGLTVHAKDTRPWREQACDGLRALWDDYGQTDFAPLVAQLPSGPGGNDVRSLFDTAHAFYVYGASAGVPAARDRGLHWYRQALAATPWGRLEPWGKGVILGAFARATLALWSELTPAERDDAFARADAEAQWYLGRLPESNDAGTVTDDTKAEENAWHADALATLSQRFPGLRNAAALESTGRCFAYHVITRPTDAAYCGMTSQTVLADYSLYNHGALSPIYTLATLMMLGRGAQAFAQAGQAVPAEYLHNAAPLFDTLAGHYDPVTFGFLGTPSDWGGATNSMYFGVLAYAYLDRLVGHASLDLQALYEARSLFFRGLDSHFVANRPASMPAFNQNPNPGLPDDYWFVNTNVAGNATTSLLEAP
jgi:hypothetical protein